MGTDCVAAAERLHPPTYDRGNMTCHLNEMKGADNAHTSHIPLRVGCGEEGVPQHATRRGTDVLEDFYTDHVWRRGVLRTRVCRTI